MHIEYILKPFFRHFASNNIAERLLPDNHLFGSSSSSKKYIHTSVKFYAKCAYVCVEIINVRKHY